jgi:hypothetical protein
MEVGAVYLIDQGIVGRCIGWDHGKNKKPRFWVQSTPHEIVVEPRRVQQELRRSQVPDHMWPKRMVGQEEQEDLEEVIGAEHPGVDHIMGFHL